MKWYPDNFYYFLTGFLLVVCMTLLGGCATQKGPQPNDPHFAPVMMPAISAQPSEPGSLYSEHSSISLFSDRKATRIGDIITVVLSEQTTSNKSANVEVTKESEIAMLTPTLFGSPLSFNGNGFDSAVTADRDFTGEAGAAQSNSLRGNISVTVVDVWPNGTLVIRGEKWMTLNRGDELIRISGIVRPGDVSVNNEVLSTRIANAKITYTGTGELAASQKMSFMNRFFNSSYWPF